MGDQDKSIFVFLKIPLQPFNMLYVQIVGRLVKKKDIRFLKQQLSKKDLGSLTAGKLRYVAAIPISSNPRARPTSSTLESIT